MYFSSRYFPYFDGSGVYNIGRAPSIMDVIRNPLLRVPSPLLRYCLNGEPNRVDRDQFSLIALVSLYVQCDVISGKKYYPLWYRYMFNVTLSQARSIILYGIVICSM